MGSIGHAKVHVIIISSGGGTHHHLQKLDVDAPLLCLPPESDPVVPPWDGWKALARTRSFCFFAVGAETGQDSRGPRERLAGYALCRTPDTVAECSARRRGWRKRKEAGAGAGACLCYTSVYMKITQRTYG